MSPQLEPFELLELDVVRERTVEFGAVVGRARSTNPAHPDVLRVRVPCAGNVWHVAVAACARVRLDDPLFQVAPVTAYTIDGPHPHVAGPGGLALTISQPAIPNSGITSYGLEFLNRRYFMWANGSFFLPAVAGTHLVQIQAYRGKAPLFSESTSVLVQANGNTPLTFDVVSAEHGRWR
jgi:hypothetical protein